MAEELKAAEPLPIAEDAPEKKNQPCLTPAAKRRRRIGWLTGVLFASPVILGVLIFNYYPMFQALFSSMTKDGEFVWFYQYETVFVYDPDTFQVFGNTLLYAVLSVPFGLVLGYFLALVANFKIKGISVYRMLFYLPVVIPAVASGVIFTYMFASVSSHGALNQIFGALGFPELTFFEEASTSMLSLIFMGVWSAGGSMIIWLSAFKNIPSTLYEAAKLDGANALQCLVKITIPMSTPLIFYNLVTGIIGALQCTTPLVVVGSRFGIKGGGAGNSLYFVAVKILNEFDFAMYEYASALAFVLFAIVGLFTLILFKTSKWVYYGEEK